MTVGLIVGADRDDLAFLLRRVRELDSELTQIAAFPTSYAGVQDGLTSVDLLVVERLERAAGVSPWTG